MKARGGGVYVGVGGMTSTKGAVGRAHVSAGKMGQAALVRGLAHDSGPVRDSRQQRHRRFIRHRPVRPSSATTSPSGNVKVPLGRKGLPADLAKLVRFVVGPDAEYISGATLHCNGGAYMNL